jgi:phage tail sheath protein FI
MAERIVSPGVFTRENDLSFLAQGIGEIGAAFIGPFKQGPAFVPTIVRTQSEFEQIFGTPDGTYYTEYAVQNYLREAGVATIVRVAGLGGYEQANPIAIFASGSDNVSKLITTLHSTEAGDEETGFTITSIANASQSLAFSLNASFGQISSSLSPTSVEDVSDVFGESPFGSKTAYVYTYFENAASGIVPNTNAISASVLPTQDFLQDTQVAETPWVKSQLIGGLREELFRFHTLGHGTGYNTKYKVSISNVKAAGEDGSTDYSVFTVTIRAFDDTDKRKVVLETYNNVNLDPASPNYIARVIGDRNATIDANGKITETGDYANKSRYVRVEVAELDSFPISSAPFAHGAYYNPVFLNGNESRVPAVVYQTGSVVNTASSQLYFAGINLETAGVKIDNHQYLKPIPASAAVGANVDFGFDSQLTYQMTGSNSVDMAKRQFTLAFQRGFDGMSPATKIQLHKSSTDTITTSNSQGFNLSTSTASGSVAYSKAIAAISNADEYDINMVVTPGVIRRLHPAVTTEVIDMVEARQDCFYLADFNNAEDTIAQATDEASEVDSNYAATYYPWVKTIDTNTNKLMSVPPSVLMPAVFASNDRLAAEWFAPAGLNRGGIVGAVSVLNRLTHSERDTLYENKVNPIASFPGQGIVAFGQKTLQDKASALDRINVRRLLITVKKYIASTSRFLVFEQNTAQTRNRFLNTANPYLEGIQQRQGLYAFRVVMDETNNTPDVIDRNILAGQIFLQPAKTAEFIVIDFNILPTGASFTA